jgi:ribosomal 30S subunit maturation factor RimM
MKLVETYIPVATIVGVHGLHGVLKVMPWVAAPDWIDWFEPTVRRGKSGEKPVRTIQITLEDLKNPDNAEHLLLRVGRWEELAPKKYRLTLPDISNRAAADRLRGAVLSVPAEAIANLAHPQTYDPGLMVGFAAKLVGSETAVGLVDDIATSGDMQFLQLAAPEESPKAGRTWLIPLSPQIVPTVEMATETVWLDHLEGFFED